MSNFVVTFRTGDGSLEEVGYEADDRKALFQRLANEGREAVSVREGAPRKAKRKGEVKANNRICLIGLAVIAVVAGVVFMNFHSGSSTAHKKVNRVKMVADAPRQAKEVPAEGSRAEKIRKIKAEVDDMVKPFIKKAATNNVLRLGEKPLDPDDPDNALRTQTMTEVQMLIGITPGEPMPPVPFTFMLEDAIIEEAEKSGETVVAVDNGNKRFLEEMKKWKITVKETDSEQRAAKKMELVETQLDLIDGIEQGVSVNDSIRAAWEFRKKAYEARKDLMATISELHESDPDVETTKELVKKANEHLAKDGIMAITIGEILPDLEEGDQ